MSRSQEETERMQQTSANDEREKVKQKLDVLNEELKAVRKVIHQSSEQNISLQKKLKDAKALVSEINAVLTLVDESDENYSEENRKLTEAKKDETLIIVELQNHNQKFEQAKLDDAKIQREIQEQQRKLEALNAQQNISTPLPSQQIPPQQTNPGINEAFRPQPTFQERRERSAHTTNLETTDKSIDVIKHLKSKCDLPGSGFHYDSTKKQIELVTPTNSTIIFTKNSASTTSNDKKDLELMAKEFLDALVRDGKDLKAVNITAQGDSKTELKEIFEKLKNAKIEELKTPRMNSLTQNQSLSDRASARITDRDLTQQSNPGQSYR